MVAPLQCITEADEAMAAEAARRRAQHAKCFTLHVTPATEPLVSVVYRPLRHLMMLQLFMVVACSRILTE